MKIPTQYIQSFMKATWANKLLVFKTCILLIKLRVLVHLLPLKLYYSKFFENKANNLPNLQPFKHEIGLINKVIKAVPFRVTCLVECMTVQSYLKQKYKIKIPISIGINYENEFKAHAWYEHSRQNDYIKINL